MRSFAKYFFLILFIINTLISCTSDNDAKLDDTNKKQPISFKIKNKLSSIPSPFQIAILIKNTQIAYKKELLNASQNTQNYLTSLKKALNIGVYGVDLGYMCMYGKDPDKDLYFRAISTLTDEIGLSHQFDDSFLKRIDKNRDDSDSVMYLLSKIYEKSDVYLFENDRSDLAALILAGGWIESLYLMIYLNEESPNEDLINRIGEQKRSLFNLIALLRTYYKKHSQQFDELLEELVELAHIFDGVDVKYTYREPKTDTSTKTTEINCVTKTIISEKLLLQISTKIKKIRTNIVL